MFDKTIGKSQKTSYDSSVIEINIKIYLHIKGERVNE